MKNSLMILLISAGLILGGCNSNKRSKNGYASRKGDGGSTTVTTTTVDKENEASANVSGNNDTLKVPNGNSGASTNIGRPRTNFGGNIGTGTGGSYSAQSYRHNQLNRNNGKRKKYFQDRMKEADKQYFGEEPAAIATEPILEDTTALQSNLEELAEDTTSTTIDPMNPVGE